MTEEWDYTIRVRYDHDARNENPHGCCRALFEGHREGVTFDTGPMDVITADGRVAEMAKVIESYLATGSLDERDMDALRQAAEPISPEPTYTRHECEYMARQALAKAFEGGLLEPEDESLYMQAADKSDLPLVTVYRMLSAAGVDAPVYQPPDTGVRPKIVLTPHEREYMAKMAGVEVE